MGNTTYEEKREKIEEYFDRTAADQWAKLTSDAPVSGIRKTVRAGRDRMRETLLSWLPEDLRGRRVLDAGCGTGTLAVELARRGAHVVAIDLSPTLVELARERLRGQLPVDLLGGKLEFVSGDMLSTTYGQFDHVIAMDSMIHYEKHDMVHGLAGLCQRTTRSVLFTFAPSNPILATMIRVGRIFPRADRAPFIEPVAESTLRGELARAADLQSWAVARTEKVSSGFYTSQAMELCRS
ncbi:MAG: magnesium protoporphyrin IX methyltransferase [Oxalobacteraceae bacterium]